MKTLNEFVVWSTSFDSVDRCLVTHFRPLHLSFSSLVTMWLPVSLPIKGPRPEPRRVPGHPAACRRILSEPNVRCAAAIRGITVGTGAVWMWWDWEWHRNDANVLEWDYLADGEKVSRIMNDRPPPRFGNLAYVRCTYPVSLGKTFLSFQFGQMNWKANALMRSLIVAEIICFTQATKFLQRPGREGLFGDRTKDGDSLKFPIKQLKGYNVIGCVSVCVMALLAFWICPWGSRPDVVAVSRPRECRQLC